MVDVRTHFPRKYMTAADLGGRVLTAQITDTELKTFSTGGPVLMLTLRHNGAEPSMVRCNLTNRDILSNAWGTETDNWVGRKLELSVRATDMGPGIAMRPIEDAKPAAPSWAQTAPLPSYPAKPTKPGRTSHIDDDEVPF